MSDAPGPADGIVPVWARLYMEEVEEYGQDIDQAMRTIIGEADDEDSEEASPT